MPLETTGIRFAAALLFALPATYLARESTRHREEATRSRRIELELTSLGPFIEPLDADIKAELRKTLVDTYFGKAFENEHPKDDSTIDISLLKTISSFLQKVSAGSKLCIW